MMDSSSFEVMFKDVDGDALAEVWGDAWYELHPNGDGYGGHAGECDCPQPLNAVWHSKDDVRSWFK